MSDDHLTTEEECPDCKGFDRCDFHEGVRRGRQQIENGNSVALDDCEKSEEELLQDVYEMLYELADCYREKGERVGISEPDHIIEYIEVERGRGE